MYIENMGAGKSKKEQLTEIINEVATNVVISNSANTSSYILNTQTLSAIGPDSRISNVELLQEAGIDISIAKDTQINAKMQAELLNDISLKLKDVKTDFPSIPTVDETKMTSIIKNKVEANLGIESVTNMVNKIEQRQTLLALDAGNMDEVKLSQNANIVSASIEKMSSDIASELISDNKSTTDQEHEKTFFLADLTDSLGGAVSGIVGSVGEGIVGPITDIFGFDDTTVYAIAFVIIVSIIVGLLIVVNKSKFRNVMTQQQRPQDQQRPQQQQYTPPGQVGGGKYDHW